MRSSTVSPSATLWHETSARRPDAGGTIVAAAGPGLHGAREEDLIEGVIPTHPLDVQDALIHYARKGAIINSTYMF